VSAGQPTSVAGGGFLPGATLQVTVDGEPAVPATTGADGAGNFAVVVTMPGTATAGAHQVVVQGTGANGALRQLVAQVHVTGGGALRVTGADVGDLVFVAFGALVLGSIALRRTRVH
jgi:hypothetical protein